MVRRVGIGTQQPQARFEPTTLRSQVRHRTTRPPHTVPVHAYNYCVKSNKCGQLNFMWPACSLLQLFCITSRIYLYIVHVTMVRREARVLRMATVQHILHPRRPGPHHWQRTVRTYADWRLYYKQLRAHRLCDWRHGGPTEHLLRASTMCHQRHLTARQTLLS